MKVIVIGGTRGLGHAVVLAAHAAGHTLTVMARNAAAFEGPVSGIRMVAGDVRDEADVQRAVAGQDVVVWALGAPPDAISTAHLHGAMKVHDVARIVCAIADGRVPADALTGDGAIEWVIVRPAPMTGSAATGLYRSETQPIAGRVKRIPRADVADFIVDNLHAPDYLRKTVYLTA